MHGYAPLVEIQYYGLIYPFLDGGAVFTWDSSPTISNCCFTDNYAERNGGAICGVISNLIITGCIIGENTAFRGGGIACLSYVTDDEHPEPTIRSCTIRSNSANRGGGIYSHGYAKIIHCIITHNTADIGGGIVIGGDNATLGSARIINSTLTKNTASSGGGAIYVGELSSPSVVNSILWLNDAPNNSEISMVCWDWGSSLSIRNSLVKRGMAAVSYVGSPQSNCQLTWGPGNIDTYPLFADPNNGDFHLNSQAGRWTPINEAWVMDDMTSPCINAGDPNSPIGEEPFPNGGIINMGAYGGTVEASKSYFGGPPCETIIAGDINGDCKVDFNDLAILAMHWLSEG